ncbi:MAG: hypothetical protein V7L23_33580 [Nostoc sp.]|uniref:hypothetical protein n=1 Tax=Nostoc sp. TaxID=1180 RepID=UPI002FF1D15D
MPAAGYAYALILDTCKIKQERSPNLIAHILHLALAIRNRGYTNEVRLRGLTENQGFETRAGGFCLV